jgi:hypothetical protein
MNEVQSAAASGQAHMTRRAPAEVRPEGARKAQGQAPKERRSPSRDTVELSDASKALAWLVEQHETEVELQLPPEKLRELAHG